MALETASTIEQPQPSLQFHSGALHGSTALNSRHALGKFLRLLALYFTRLAHASVEGFRPSGLLRPPLGHAEHSHRSSCRHFDVLERLLDGLEKQKGAQGAGSAFAPLLFGHVSCQPET